MARAPPGVQVKLQFRKLPWATCEGYVIKSLLKVHKCKYNQVTARGSRDG